MHTEWNLEEIPYRTNDKAGGWYLHFDPTGDTGEEPLYLSKSEISEANAHRIVTAVNAFDDMYEALLSLWNECNKIGFPLGIKPSSLVMSMGNAMKALSKEEGQ